MQLVKPVTNQSWWILDRIFPGRANFLMQKTAHDRMEAVATYLAHHIKVKNKALKEVACSLRQFSLDECFE